MPGGHFEVKRSSNEWKERRIGNPSFFHFLYLLGASAHWTSNKRHMGCKEPSRVGGMETALCFSSGPSLLASNRRATDLVSKILEIQRTKMSDSWVGAYITNEYQML